MRGLLQHWTESSTIFTSKEGSVWRNKRPRSRAVSFAADRLLTWSMSTSRSQEPTILSRIMPTYLQLFFEMMIFRNSIRSGMEIINNDENPTWWHLGRIVQIKNTRVWETQDRIGIVQYGDSLEVTDWRHWWQELSSRIHMKGTPRSRFKRQNSVYKELWEVVGNGKATGSVLKVTIAICVTISQSVQNWHSRMRLRILSCNRMKENHREPKSLRKKSQCGRVSRWPCKDYLKGTCTNSFCEKWHPTECLFYKAKSGCRFGKSAPMHIVRLMNNLVKGPKEWWQKCCVYVEKGKLARKRSCHRWMSRSTGETWEEEW